MLGAGWALVVLAGHFTDGWTGLYAYALEQNKLQCWDFNPSPTTPHITLWIGLVGGAFLSLASHGTDQLTVQRLLSARSTRDARWALIGSGFVVLVQFALFLLIGIGLAGFHASSPADATPTENTVFADFVVNHMSVGVVGIILAAVFSAAMSTLSSSLNASASVLIHDLLPGGTAHRDERHLLAISRGATLIFGIVQMVIAIVAAGRVSDTSVVYLVLKIAAFTSGPILGIFLLGTFVRGAGQASALIGFFVGLATLFATMFCSDVNGLWYTAIGSLVTLGVGWAVNRLIR